MVKLARFDHLREFMAAGSAGSLSKAAATLGTSVAHVSRKLDALEADLGQTLLQRGPRGCRLTEVGMEFYQRCQVLLEGMEEARDAVMQRRAEIEGGIRISVGGHYAERRLLPLFAQFCRDKPQVRMEVRLETRNVDLVAEGIDLAIRLGPLADSRYVATKLIAFRAHTLASPTYLNGRKAIRTPSDLPQDQCLSLGGRPWVFGKGARRTVIEPGGRVRADNGLALIEAAKAGVGIVQLPSYYGDRELAEGSLVQVLESWPLDGVFEFYCVTPPSSYMPHRIRALIQFLKTSLGSAPWASA